MSRLCTESSFPYSAKQKTLSQRARRRYNTWTNGVSCRASVQPLSQKVLVGVFVQKVR